MRSRRNSGEGEALPFLTLLLYRRLGTRLLPAGSLRGRVRAMSPLADWQTKSALFKDPDKERTSDLNI